MHVGVRIRCVSSENDRSRNVGSVLLSLQVSDGQCLCKSGHEFYDVQGTLVSTVDSASDCQPIVYERCETGEALDANGVCVSER